MARMVHCVKLGKELEGLNEVPFDNHPLGQKIYENVSAEAWRQWVEHMKMIMNEYRLNLGTREAQEFLLRRWNASSSARGPTCRLDSCPKRRSEVERRPMTASLSKDR